MRDINNLHWIKAIGPNEYNMVLDHHMLATWRLCQIHFQHLHMEGRRPKNGYGWSLEFGTLFHKIVEDIYAWRKEGLIEPDRVIARGIELWDEGNMDRFKEHPTCVSLGGKPGFITLCLQYISYYNEDTERLRIVGTEISFGQSQEVSLGTFFVTKSFHELYKINCYLSGKIDFLAEDGRKIGPVDHKTRSLFGKKDLSIEYTPHEGMTGYIYAAKQIVSRIPEMAHLQCNSAWMNFVQVANQSDMSKRFRRIIVMRTDQQLSDYRIRQLETFKDIFNYVDLDRTATWNTEACTHWYGTTCMYQGVHRQPDRESQLIVLDNDFTKGKFWNPETETEDDGTVSRNKSSNEAAVQEQGV